MSGLLPNLLTISLGAAAGACLRWGLGLAALRFASPWPLGTLAANWLGAYAIGLAAAYFAAHSELSPAYKLLIATGFLGGLTTFSTFSLEAVQLLQTARYADFATHFALHTIGCMLLTVLGMASYKGALA
ncbi:MAG: fluoride efflux transporter CrcB [Brachymonas sp.]